MRRSGENIRIGQEVEIYRNLHGNCFSVRDVKLRRVIAHVDQFALVDAKMIVSQAGRNRVLKERRKNVHACIRGKWHDWTPSKFPHPNRLTYDPYLYKSFVDADSRVEVLEADAVDGYSPTDIRYFKRRG